MEDMEFISKFLSSEEVKISKSTTELTKGTHIDLFNSMQKVNGEHVAILSCTSVDRDGDEVDVSALRKMAKDNDYTVILVDHENKVENIIGEWTNKKVVKVDDMYALVAVPKFYDDVNPKAAFIKGLLDKGARVGISIGAKVVDYEQKGEENGWPTYRYTELELMEASFVAIPSNRHGQAMAVAKSLKTKREVKTMEEKIYTQKDFDSKIAESNKDLEKKLTDEQEAFKSYKADAEKKLASANDELKKANELVEKQTADLKELQDLKVFKAKIEDEQKASSEVDKTLKEDEDLRKQYEAKNLKI